MKIPFSWILDHVDLDVTPSRLGEDLTGVGLALDGLFGSGEDAVLDLDITTNRVDCMNVRGVAREASVIYRRPLKALDLQFVEEGEDASKSLAVEVASPDLCGRFAARVMDVRAAPSPAWLARRLEAAGIRSISNVVDVTNYVMLELGQPTHAFDLALVPGGKLVARWARPGERLTTLDGVERELHPEIGVVAAPDGPLAIAGVMGGASSEVGPATRTIALEAAYWDPMAVRRAARRLAMHTEASHRFERHSDPEAQVTALARIAHLFERIGAGRTRPGTIDVLPEPRHRRTILVRQARVDGLLGVAVATDDVRRIVSGLGFAVCPRGEGDTDVVVPSWRNDVRREVDIIEEVGRHIGLGRIPASFPAASSAVGLSVAQRRERLIRETLVASGFSEVVNLSFARDDTGQGGPAVRLKNPLSEDQAILRSSLVLPGLLDTLGRNVRQGRRSLALFEIGRVFVPDQGLPREPRRVGLLASGSFGSVNWSAPPRAATFFDLKGVLETLGTRLGVSLVIEQADRPPSHLHPGQAASVRHGDVVLGWVGVLHPDVPEARGLRDEAVVAEIDIDSLLATTPSATRFVPIVRFPAVERDLSVLCPAGLRGATVIDAIRQAGGALLRSAEITSRFDRPPVPAGSASITVRLTFQDSTRTLTSDEVQAAVESIIRTLRDRGAEIRGE